MDESIALTKQKQKSFKKYVKKTKEKIKKGKVKLPKRFVRKFNDAKSGTIYVGNIPHGFYGNELTDYFGQFGEILKVRVSRSHKTGNSRGYAFVKFKEKAVAKIAAETMNNYLMGKRILKTKFVTNEKKSQAFFKHPNFSKEHYPTKVRQQKFKKTFNAAITDDKYKQKTLKAMKHIRSIKRKLLALGINYDFTPVNIPEYVMKSEKNTTQSDNEKNFKIEEDSKLNVEVKDSIHPKKIKKNKQGTVTEQNDNKNQGKKKQKKIKVVQNTTNENNENNQNIKREKKNKKQLKQSIIENNENSLLETAAKIESKREKKKIKIEELDNVENKKKIKNNKVKGIIKKSKKSEKIASISNKKAVLLREQIKNNTQIKTVTKLEKKKKKVTKG